MNTLDDLSGNEPPTDELLAAEYVLGVLGEADRLHAQARVLAEPGFAARVDDWTRKLTPLFDGIEAVDAPAHVWPRIRARLGWSPVERAPRGAWDSVGFWRASAAAAAALAAMLAVVALRQPALPPAAPVPSQDVVTAPAAPAEEVARPVVVLEREGGVAGWLAAIDPSRSAITMTPVPTAASADGRVGELWLIPAGGAPRSLGFVSNELSHTVQVPDDLRDAVAAGAVLAVTLEPEQGIPHAAPTGPVVAKGDIRSI